MRTTDVTPLVLVVLDGWGHTDSTEFNAIHSAYTPAWDKLWERCPRVLLGASGSEVGLPDQQMGNSEVGHMHIGAGRLLDQELTRINRSITDGSFYANEVLVRHLEQAAAGGNALHVLGLLSSGGVHSHEDHMLALVRMAVQRGVRRVYLHAFLDGRDTPPRCAEESVQHALGVFQELGHGRIASLVGRYYAMDRNHNWQRTRTAYELIAGGHGEYQCDDPLIAIDQAYARGETDEFVKATTILEAGRPVSIGAGDLVLFANFRADRARQLTRAFTEREFSGFERGAAPVHGAFVTLTRYDQQYDLPVAYPPPGAEERFRGVRGPCRPETIAHR